MRTRAGLILAGELSAAAYADQFDAQMRRGKLRTLLYASYVQFARTGAVVFGLDPGEICVTSPQRTIRRSR